MNESSILGSAASLMNDLLDYAVEAAKVEFPRLRGQG
jgi:hypothetical protein